MQNSKLSHWAQYHQETEGHSCFENEFGFVRYHFAPPLCVVHDLFVAPEFRKQGKGLEIMSRVTQEARERECTHLWSKVTDAMLTVNESLAANLHYGFRVVRIDQGAIIMLKAIGEDNG